MGTVPNAMVEEAKGVFLEAMRQGYASGMVRMAAPVLPGTKSTEFKRGLWRVVDTWISGNGGHSAGWTTMFMGDHAFWQMSYQGRYEQRALPFLKRALMENYSKNIFLGGRGPENFSDGSGDGLLIYKNEPLVSAHSREPTHEFDEFYRIETITSIRKTDEVKSFSYPVGFHRVQGMRLVYV